MFIGPKTSYMEANIQKDEETNISAVRNTHMRLTHDLGSSHMRLWNLASTHISPLTCVERMVMGAFRICLAGQD